jgi:hypothetical protein
VVTTIFNSLAANNVLPNANVGTCKTPVPATGQAGLKWTYKISPCPDDLTISIDRGLVSAPGPPVAVGTVVTVSYPYHWRFNSVIQLLFPGPSGYAAITQVTESATVHNQM